MQSGNERSYFRREEIKVCHDGRFRVDHHFLREGCHAPPSASDLPLTPGSGTASSAGGRVGHVIAPPADASGAVVGLAVESIVGPIFVGALAVVQPQQGPDAIRPHIDYCICIPDFLKVPLKKLKIMPFLLK